MSVERQNNGMMLGLLTAPGIFGLALGVMPTAAPFKIVVEMTCKGYYLPASTTLMLLERHQLWREAFYWMTWQNRLLDARDVQLVGTTSYNQIRSTLLSMAQWDAALRARIGVMSYIQRRTHISRSVIAEVLSALRQGDYIRMQKGKLVSINRLPSEY
nr:helix-turn-helix domain-containing protein [uncultured Enterobacter sp.]